MDKIIIGAYLKSLRKSTNLTQKELAKKLNISFQAISKWEKGETLPDTRLLVSLSEILNTTCESILMGGKESNYTRKYFSLNNIEKFIEYILKCKELFGKEFFMYQGLIDGISENLNIVFEKYLYGDLEELYHIIIINAIISGKYYVKEDEIENFFKSEKIKEDIKKYIGRINKSKELQ